MARPLKSDKYNYLHLSRALLSVRFRGGRIGRVSMSISAALGAKPLIRPTNGQTRTYASDGANRHREPPPRLPCVARVPARLEEYSQSRWRCVVGW